jgi:formamidopyrimidine-DNA glycosylase
VTVPELPEVETMVRGIRPFAEGRTIAAARRCRCERWPILVEPNPAVIRRRAGGETITSVRRVAKRIVLELSSGDAFLIEPRMTGLMLAADPPTTEHLRFEWTFDDRRAPDRILFWDRRGLGTVRLLTVSALQDLEAGGRIGPDPLSLSASDWHPLLQRTARPIKVALLDQTLVAGIGNLYASEILHLAGIHPERRSNELSVPQTRRLHEATQTVLLTAIEYEGSTLGDGTYRNALNESGGYQNAHRVYAREHEMCLTCRRGLIRRFVQAQRSTFFCPVCQRPPRGGAQRSLVPASAARRTRG